MEEKNNGEIKPNFRKLKKLQKRIKNQMEFYFSDSNLVKDKFLNDLISKDPDGYVDLEVFKKFNKIKTLTGSCEVIASSVLNSNMFELSPDHKRIRRITPIDKTKDFDACTLYVERLPRHADQKWIKDVLGHIGTIKYVNVPRHKISNKIKGFAFVEFENPDDVRKACEFYKISPSEESSSEDESKHIKNAIKHKHEENINNKKNKRSRIRSGSFDKLTDFSSLKSNQQATSISDKDMECEKGNRKRKRKASSDEVSVKRPKESGTNTKILTKCNDQESLVYSQMKHEVRTEELKEDNDELKKEQSDEKAESEDVNVSENHENTSLEKTKTKRKRKQKKKHSSNSEKQAIRVMPKSEWKAYRNKYLDLQRSTMSLIKKQILQETQELKERDGLAKPIEVPEPRKTFQFHPGVIIKILLSQPVENPSETKNQVKANAVVAYIDASAGNTEVFIRCHNPEDAQAIIKEEKFSQLGKTTLLEGNEEKKYWEKIDTDRKNKFNNPVPHKKRGREKLLAKAAKLEEMRNKHIYFE